MPPVQARDRPHRPRLQEVRACNCSPCHITSFSACFCLSCLHVLPFVFRQRLALFDGCQRDKSIVQQITLCCAGKGPPPPPPPPGMRPPGLRPPGGAKPVAAARLPEPADLKVLSAEAWLAFLWSVCETALTLLDRMPKAVPSDLRLLACPSLLTSRCIAAAQHSLQANTSAELGCHGPLRGCCRCVTQDLTSDLPHMTDIICSCTQACMLLHGMARYTAACIAPLT